MSENQLFDVIKDFALERLETSKSLGELTDNLKDILNDALDAAIDDWCSNIRKESK